MTHKHQYNDKDFLGFRSGVDEVSFKARDGVLYARTDTFS
jgi:hypothetical protein